MRVGGQMNVHLSWIADAVAAADPALPGALECCSGQRTPGGGTSPTSL